MQRIKSWVDNLSLWPRLAIGISAGFLLLFVAFAVVGEGALDESSELILEDRLVIAQIAANQVDELFHQAVHELEEVNKFSEFDFKNPGASVDADILDYTNKQTRLFAEGLLFIDVHGKVMLSYPTDLCEEGEDLSDRPYIARALKERDVVISDPFVETKNNRPVAAITLPVFEGEEFVGLLSGFLDLGGPAMVDPLRHAATLGHTGHATLFDRDGVTLASTLPVPFQSPSEHPDLYRKVIATGQRLVEEEEYELEGIPGETKGDIHVMAAVPLTTVPWGVAVGGDEVETFAGVKRLRLGLLLLSGAALVVVWVGTLIGARKLVRPIQQVTEAAQQIADGELHTPLEVTGMAEIGVMATALDRMRKQMLANIEELADWNQKLETRVTEQTVEIREQQALTKKLLHKTLTAQEEERGRLARELHDQIGQSLMAVEIHLSRIANSLPDDDEESLKRVEQGRTVAQQATKELRQVIAALRPGVLDQLGLVPALNWMSKHTLRPLGLKVDIKTSGLDKRFPDEIETILFRIAQEAMNNVARHSKAESLEISLQRVDEQAMMTLSDDGCGYDLSAVRTEEDYSRGLGLAGMQERASLVGGKVTVESEPGQGTMVRVMLPVPAAANGRNNHE